MRRLSRSYTPANGDHGNFCSHRDRGRCFVGRFRVRPASERACRCGASCHAKRGNKHSDACRGLDRCCAIFGNADYSNYDDTDPHNACRRYFGDAFVWASVDTDESGDNCTFIDPDSRSNSDSDSHANADVRSNTYSNRDSHSESDTGEYGNSKSISDR